MTASLRIRIPDYLPYRIAAEVMPQGVECDALAGKIRARLRDWLTTLVADYCDPRNHARRLGPESRASSTGDAWTNYTAAHIANGNRLRAAINDACAIIETGDARLLAGDGPAGNQPPDLTLYEWRRLYVILDTARRA